MIPTSALLGGGLIVALAYLAWAFRRYRGGLDGSL